MIKKLSAVAAIAALALVSAASGALAGPGGTTGGQPFDVNLVAEEEVAPFVGVEGASGEGVVRFNRGQERICADIEIDNFTPVLAHIHVGEAGTNGDVVVDLTPLITASGDLVGCVDAERSLVKQISKNPEGYYVNTHADLPPFVEDGSDAFFDGIRGQLA